MFFIKWLIFNFLTALNSRSTFVLNQIVNRYLLKSLKFSENFWLFIKWLNLTFQKASTLRSTFVFDSMVKPYLFESLKFQVNLCFYRMINLTFLVDPYFLDSLGFEVNFCPSSASRSVIFWTELFSLTLQRRSHRCKTQRNSISSI